MSDNDQFGYFGRENTQEFLTSEEELMNILYSTHPVDLPAFFFPDKGCDEEDLNSFEKEFQNELPILEWEVNSQPDSQVVEHSNFNGEEEEKESTSTTLPQSFDSEGDKNPDGPGRGRPKKDMTKTPEDLKKAVYNWLVKEIKKIQRSIEKDNESLQNKGGARKRDDKPRTKIIRLVKKIPDKILKTLVSIGDYKHTSPDRLFEAYSVALSGLMNLLGIYNLHLSESNDVASCEHSVTLLKFAVIHFPKSKVEALTSCSSMSFVNGFNVQVLLKDRDSTSVKKLKKQMDNNHIVRLLFSLAYELLKDHLEFQDSLKILFDLTQL